MSSCFQLFSEVFPLVSRGLSDMMSQYQSDTPTVLGHECLARPIIPPSLLWRLLGCWLTSSLLQFSITADSQTFCPVSLLAAQPWWPSQTPLLRHLLSWQSILNNQRRWFGWPCLAPPLASQAPECRNISKILQACLQVTTQYQRNYSNWLITLFSIFH